MVQGKREENGGTERKAGGIRHYLRCAICDFVRAVHPGTDAGCPNCNLKAAKGKR